MNNERTTHNLELRNRGRNKFWPFILLLLISAAAFAQDIDIVGVEYFWNVDPGLGNGTAITLDSVNTDSAFAAFSAPAEALPPGLHRLYVRYLDSEGVWSPAEGRYINILNIVTSDYQPLAITQAEYFFDNLPSTLIDVVDSSDVDVAELASSAGLGPGLHRFFIRYQDERGAWSGAEGRYVYIFSPWTSDFDAGLITQAEYHFDNLAPITVDVSDGETVNIAELASTDSLDFGLHRLHVRYLDNRGLWSGMEGRYVYIVTPQPAPFVANNLVGGEYWVETDPGIGNGIPFEAADDGAWDEGDESTTFYVSGFPLGPTYIGLRFYDAFGVWTPTIQDTIIAGPVLVIHRSGNSLVLDWIPSSETEGRPFHVWRAEQVGGPFVEVDSTDSLTWTDLDILDSPLKHYYYIRQTLSDSAGVLNDYRGGLRPSSLSRGN